MNKRLNVAWLVLVGITVSYALIDRSRNGTAVTVAAIALALVKYRIILRSFMDVRRAPPVLRRITDLLVVVIAVALFASYFAGKA